MALLIFSPDDSFEIATDPGTAEPGNLPHAFFIGSEGMYGLPETDSQPIERSYSDGAVKPRVIRRSSKDFTVDILLTDLGDSSLSKDDILDSYIRIQYAVEKETVGVSDGTMYIDAQCQKIEFLTNELDRRKKVAVIRMYFRG